MKSNLLVSVCWLVWFKVSCSPWWPLSAGITGMCHYARSMQYWIWNKGYLHARQVFHHLSRISSPLFIFVSSNIYGASTILHSLFLTKKTCLTTVWTDWAVKRVKAQKNGHLIHLWLNWGTVWEKLLKEGDSAWVISNTFVTIVSANHIYILFGQQDPFCFVSNSLIPITQAHQKNERAKQSLELYRWVCNPVRKPITKYFIMPARHGDTQL